MSRCPAVRVLVLGMLLATLPASAQEPRSAISYDEFRRLDAGDQLKTFNTLGSANKAFLVRTHLQFWTAENRNRLSRQQLEVIDYAERNLSARLYDSPRDPEVVKIKEMLGLKVACGFDPRDAMQAFSVVRDASHGPQPEATWMARVFAWFERASACVRVRMKEMESQE